MKMMVGGWRGGSTNLTLFSPHVNVLPLSFGEMVPGLLSGGSSKYRHDLLNLEEEEEEEKEGQKRRRKKRTRKRRRNRQRKGRSKRRRKKSGGLRGGLRQNKAFTC